MEKAEYLRSNGWKEVPSDNGGTCWLGPTRFQQAPLYFALDAAYELETTGEGVWAYAGAVALGEALEAEDRRLSAEAEAKYFRETGLHHGVAPNF